MSELTEAEYHRLSCQTAEEMEACDVEIDRLRRELAFHLARYHGHLCDELFAKEVYGSFEPVAELAKAFKKSIGRTVNQYEAEHIIPLLHAAGKLPSFSVIDGGRH